MPERAPCEHSQRDKDNTGYEEAVAGLRVGGLRKPPGVLRPTADEQEGQDHKREGGRDQQNVHQHAVQAELGVVAEAFPTLEPERCPVVRVVPVDHRGEKDDRDQDRQVGFRSEEPAACAPVKDAERQGRGTQGGNGVLGEQTEPQRDSDTIPGTAVVSDERPMQEIQGCRPCRRKRCIRGGHQPRGEEGVGYRSRERRGQ